MKRVIRASVVTLLAYLFQVCVMQHLKIYGVVGNLLAVNIAILTVSYGRKYTFGASCVTGILLEAMTSSVGGLYPVLYPVISMLLTYLFADMSDEKRERMLLRQNETNKPPKGDRDPHLRIPLNAMCISLGIEAILLVYVTLSGTEIAFALVLRAFVSVLYTGVLALALMIPVRYFLGIYGRRVRRAVLEEELE